MKIIFDSNRIDYENFCLVHEVDTLEGRRIELCKSFSKKSLLMTSVVCIIIISLP